MNSKVVILAVGVVCLASIVVATRVIKVEEKKFMCAGKELTSTEELNKYIATCTEEEKAQKGTGAPAGGKKAVDGMGPCFTACLMAKDGSIKDGKLVTDALNKRIDSVFPDVARAALKKDMAACSSSIAETLSTDHNCKSYDALHKCLIKASETNCKNKTV